MTYATFILLKAFEYFHCKCDGEVQYYINHRVQLMQRSLVVHQENSIAWATPIVFKGAFSSVVSRQGKQKAFRNSLA